MAKYRKSSVLTPPVGADPATLAAWARDASAKINAELTALERARSDTGSTSVRTIVSGGAGGGTGGSSTPSVDSEDLRRLIWMGW